MSGVADERRPLTATPSTLPAPRPADDLLLVTPRGPVLPGRRAPLGPVQPGTLVHLLTGRQRVVAALLSLGWLATSVWFWTWWVQPEHRVGWTGLLLNTVVLVYVMGVPLYFVIAVNRLRGVDPELPVPDLRVAFVVTKAPSEPWEVARRTLEAMLAQQYPHGYDVWLCDEDPSLDTELWCLERGVRVSTRRGREDYHRATWPRRTRCKEGNLAFFYDTHGYRGYDVVAQLDCDHVPTPTYLAEVVRPFADPGVGYVAAPSVCDTNAASSWSARGRLYREASFHGPQQTGHNGGLAPMCIGSHYAVRTAALHQIGGVGPELAEDFSTSFLLTSAGWNGAFAHRAEAHGDGPPTFAAMLVQEFQWSRSVTTLLLGIVPRHALRLPWRLWARYAFALSWYPLVGLTTLLGAALPVVAALTGRPWISVSLLSFVLHVTAVNAWLLAMQVLVRRAGLMRPADAPLVSWQGLLYDLARWPVFVQGVLDAVRQGFMTRSVVFRVTPKGERAAESLPLGAVLPYLGLSTAMSVAAIVGGRASGSAGYALLCLVGAAAYCALVVAVPLLHAREQGAAAGLGTAEALRRTAAVPFALALATLVPLAVAVALYDAPLAPLLSL